MGSALSAEFEQKAFLQKLGAVNSPFVSHGSHPSGKGNIFANSSCIRLGTV
jgi:hypothetical protein